jgi:predicted small lipoprotein YifL
MCKRLLWIFMCLVLVFSMTSCGSAPQTPPAESQIPAQSESSAEQPADLSTLEGWGAAVKAKSDGKEITVAMATHPVRCIPDNADGLHSSPESKSHGMLWRKPTSRANSFSMFREPVIRCHDGGCVLVSEYASKMFCSN